MQLMKNPNVAWFGIVLVLGTVLSTLAVERLGAHGGDSSLVHGCVRDEIGLVILIGEDETCPTNWTARDWETQGPVGPPGSTGSQGARGDSGPVGSRGSAGPAGPAGAQGDKGDTGLAGPPGSTGSQGPKGDSGAVGSRGPAGSAGPAGPAGPAGAQGAKGATGLTGARGFAGATGPKGDPGISGIQLVTLSTKTISGNTSQTLRDSCPAGKKLLSGGPRRDSGQVAIVSSSYPVSQTDWFVRIRNDSSSSTSYQLFLLCANVAP